MSALEPPSFVHVSNWKEGRLSHLIWGDDDGEDDGDGVTSQTPTSFDHWTTPSERCLYEDFQVKVWFNPALNLESSHQGHLEVVAHLWVSDKNIYIRLKPNTLVEIDLKGILAIEKVVSSSEEPLSSFASGYVDMRIEIAQAKETQEQGLVDGSYDGDESLAYQELRFAKVEDLIAPELSVSKGLDGLFHALQKAHKISCDRAFVNSSKGRRNHARMDIEFIPQIGDVISFTSEEHDAMDEQDQNPNLNNGEMSDDEEANFQDISESFDSEPSQKFTRTS